jgi:hypothetical protein
MRVHLVDPSGHALGLALGLAEAGHRVDYARPLAWASGARGGFTAAIAELAQLRCGEPARFAPLADADAVVLVDCFADRADDLSAARHLQPQAPVHAWETTLDPRLYPMRLLAMLKLGVAALAAAKPVVVLDTSDRAGPREPAFEGLPGAILLARESAALDPGPWRPFPFLYNPTMLVLERARDAGAWLRPLQARRRGPDWAFCGTIDHPRYGRRRKQAIEAVQQNWPHLRGDVAGGVSFFEALQRLQAARCALDLPGAGRLCFRVHEALALGIPLFAPRLAWSDARDAILWPDALATVRFADPRAALDCPTDHVLEVYRDGYSTAAAARRLTAELAVASPAKVGLGADQNGIPSIRSSSDSFAS